MAAAAVSQAAWFSGVSFTRPGISARAHGTGVYKTNGKRLPHGCVRPQVAWFSGVDAVVLAHGAASTNAIFMPNGTAVVEVLPWPHRWYHMYDKQVGRRGDEGGRGCKGSPHILAKEACMLCTESLWVNEITAYRGQRCFPVMERESSVGEG